MSSRQKNALYFLAIAGAILFLWSFATLAHAQTVLTNCGPRGPIITMLRNVYQEQAIATGMDGENAYVEIFVSPEATWTFLHTDAAGVSCIVGSGKDWIKLHYMPLTGARPQ